MRKITVTGFLLLALLPAAAVHAETNTARPLQPAEFIRLSCSNHPQWKATESDYRSQLFSVSRIKAIKDLYLSSSVSATGLDSYKQYGIEQARNYTGYSFNTTLSKSTPELLGMQAQIKFDWSRMQADIMSSPSPILGYKSQTPSLTASISFPLLSNFLGKADRAKLEAMALQLQLLKQVRDEAQQSFIVKLHHLYYDWALLAEKAEIYRGFMGRAGGLLAQTVRKQRVGLAEYSDVYLTQQNWLQYQALYKATVLQEEQKYMELIGYMTGKQVDRSVLSNRLWKPASGVLGKPEQLNTAAVKPEATRLARIADLQRQAAAQNAISELSLSRPQLKLLFSGGISGSADKLADAFDNFSDKTLYGGLEFSYAFGNNDAGNKAKAARAEFKKQQQLYRDTLVKISTGLSSLDQSIRVLQDVVKTTEAMVGSSAARVASLYQQYNQGRVALMHIVDARNIYAQARMSLLDQIVQLRKTAVELESLQGILLNRYTPKS